MSLLRQGKTQALTIYLGESDEWQDNPDYVTITQFLREQGCAGATATRAIAGSKAGSRRRAARESAHLPLRTPRQIALTNRPADAARLS